MRGEMLDVVSAVHQLRPAGLGGGRRGASVGRRRDDVVQLTRRVRAPALSPSAQRVQPAHRQLGAQRLSAVDRRPAAVGSQRVSRPLGVWTDRLQCLAARRRPVLYRVHLEPLPDRVRSFHGDVLPAVVPRRRTHKLLPRLRLRGCRLDNRGGRVPAAAVRLERSLCQLRRRARENLPDGRG